MPVSPDGIKYDHFVESIFKRPKYKSKSLQHKSDKFSRACRVCSEGVAVGSDLSMHILSSGEH